ncbi:MAG TPA: hypothetical protein VH835_16225 [Dongiaceae bacterium]
MPELSNEPAVKLLAARICDPGNRKQNDPEAYAARCRAWFDGLAESDQVLVASIWHTLKQGDADLALKVAGLLPPAPAPTSA